MSERHPLHLTNSMGRKLEEFEPLEPGRVRMYSCGPTVYNFAHIGNFRSFIMADVLRRVLEYNGYEVDHVRNITDVGHLTDETLGTGIDRMEKTARETNRTPWDIARYFTEAFFRDAERLNLEMPAYSPRATEYVPSMIKLAERLQAAGRAYTSDGNLFFDVSTFPSYGKLSGNTVEDLVAGARVEVDEAKRAPADFALWKAAGPDKIMRWESPWGTGVPGWHLECSAMAMDLLGDQIDIHTGGIDNMFPHHEDEIAQSEGATGQAFARYWLHSAWLLGEGGEKMSKSLGNIYTIEDLVQKGVHPLSFRYFNFQANYRTPMNFSWDAQFAAQTALYRIWEMAAELRQSASPEELGPEGEAFKGRFHAAINRDLDMPGALAVLHEMLGTKLPQGQKLTLLADFDRVLGLCILEQAEVLSATTPQQEELLQQRAEARAQKDWKRSDELRAQLRSLGLEVKDTAGGQRWVRSELLPQGRPAQP